MGPGWKQEPSDADIKFVRKFPKTAGPDHFVISEKTVYHIDDTGNVTEADLTSALLK